MKTKRVSEMLEHLTKYITYMLVKTNKERDAEAKLKSDDLRIKGI